MLLSGRRSCSSTAACLAGQRKTITGHNKGRLSACDQQSAPQKATDSRAKVQISRVNIVEIHHSIWLGGPSAVLAFRPCPTTDHFLRTACTSGHCLAWTIGHPLGYGGAGSSWGGVSAKRCS